MEDTKARLEKMTTREIAHEAVDILYAQGYDKAKVVCQLHIEVVNARLKEKNDELNKEFGTHRSAPKVKTVTDFRRFR